MAKKFKIRFKPNWPALRAKSWRITVRCYAAMILLTLLYCGYLSVAYLVRTVFYPGVTPLEVQTWATRLDVSALRSDNAAAVEEPSARAPISHFHPVDHWLQPDRLNGCTISGCHQPLPHDLRAKVPAFANFHTTFLACQMCHAPSTKRPGEAKWVDIETGRPQGSPAILRLLNLLETNTDAIAHHPADVQRQITSLLSESITAMGGDPALDELLSQIEASEPGSPVWKQSVTFLTAELPQHARGEYRAKLIWSDLADSTDARFQLLTEQAGQYSAAVDDEQRRGVVKEIHASLATSPAKCLACHDEKPGMLDFASVGFSAKRSDYLGKLEIARLMQQIRQGERFYLPNLELGQ